jgi:hypothetical protein
MEALTFYEVEIFGPPHDGMWTLCPTCLRRFERDVAAWGRGSVRLEAVLPPNTEHPRHCSGCERPQLAPASWAERAPAQWDEGVRQARAEEPPF